MEGCERCPLSHSIEWHWFHVTIPTDKSYYKINIIFGRAIPFSTSRGIMKVVKDVHCPLLLMDTGLMSLSADESYYKKKLNLDVQFPFFK